MLSKIVHVCLHIKLFSYRCHPHHIYSLGPLLLEFIWTSHEFFIFEIFHRAIALILCTIKVLGTSIWKILDSIFRCLLVELSDDNEPINSNGKVSSIVDLAVSDSNFNEFYHNVTRRQWNDFINNYVANNAIKVTSLYRKQIMRRPCNSHFETRETMIKSMHLTLEKAIRLKLDAIQWRNQLSLEGFKNTTLIALCLTHRRY